MNETDFFAEIQATQTLEELTALEERHGKPPGSQIVFAIQRELLEADLKSKEADLALLEAERALLEADLKSKGDFYDTIENIFGDEDVDVAQNPGSIRIKRTETPRIYEETFSEEKLSFAYGDAEPAMVKDSSMGTEEKALVYPKDIFGNVSNGDIAHLVPNAPGCAVYFEDVAPWVLGLTNDIPRPRRCTARSWNNICKRRNIEELLSKRNQAVILGLKHKGKKSKEAKSALKQLALNKIRLNSQGMYFGTYPCLLIIPLLSIDDILGDTWQGGYSVMVAVGSFGGTEYKPSQTVAKAVNMAPNSDNGNDHCTPDELRLACELLRASVGALATSMTNRPRSHFEKATTFRRELLKTFDQIGESGTIRMPVLNGGCTKVVRVSFGGDFHIPPDPLLLAIKSAVVWSCRNGQRLLPACPPPPDDWTDLDYYFAEQHIAREQAKLRPQNREELAAGLGQL